jgi:Rer1 family
MTSSLGDTPITGSDGIGEKVSGMLPQEGTMLTQLSKYWHAFARRYQKLLDDSTPQLLYRWIFTGVLALTYLVRVYLLEGFYIITYALGIYLLNLLIGFLSPHIDPETIEEEAEAEGPELPTKVNDEFKPFIRRLPEFQFW